MTYYGYILLIYFACFSLIGMGAVFKRSKLFRWAVLFSILVFVGLMSGNSMSVDLALILFVFMLAGLVFSYIQGIVFTQKHLGEKWRGLWIGHAVLFTVIFLPIYWAVYPRDQFYIDEFSTHTGYKLPAEIKVIYKDATFPDPHGDYYSQAIIVLEKPDYEKLVSTLVPSFAGSGCLDRAPESHRGVTYYPTGCYSKKIEHDRHISVTYFAKQNALYYFYIQT